MIRPRTIKGFYGSGNTPCNVFVWGGWYVVESGCVVNRTSQPELLVDGVNVELLEDYDCFTWPEPINSEEELETAVEA